MQITEKNKTQTVPVDLEYNGIKYTGTAVPLSTSCVEGACYELDVTLNNEHLGTIYCGSNGVWTMAHIADQGLVDAIGQVILMWYE